MAFVLCCLETAVAWGTHSGHLKPYWKTPTVVNEKRTMRVSLVSIIFIRFPDALSGNEAANFIHSLGC